LLKRLEALGLRPVNNIVDITNYVMLELGQPLHAFDLNLLHEKRIVVRRAKDGEPFEAINHEQYKLTSDMLVIADGDRAMGVAGVMGGVDSEVTEATTDVLLEAARFVPLNIRRTARALKLSSDASFRFERGVDPQGVLKASARAAKLILELAGGTLAPGVVVQGDEGEARPPITLRPARCNQLLGTDISADDMVGMLSRLGFAPALNDAGDQITCQPPTFRLDMHREIDLVEEVARSFGLANISAEDHMPVQVRPVQDAVQAGLVLSQTLVAHGFHEAITPSLISLDAGRPFLHNPNEGGDGVALVDERRKADPLLRPSLLPSLLLCRKRNQDVGNAGVKLYEIASSWTEHGDGITERRTLTLLADAGEETGHALRSLRSTVEEVVEQLGGAPELAALQLTETESKQFAPALAITLGGQAIGQLGLLKQPLWEAFDLQAPVVAAELDHALLIALFPPKHVVGDLPRFPAIERDLSVIVAESVTWEQIAKAVADTQPDLLEGTAFIGVYRGKPIAKGSKSVTLRMQFRDPSRTLTHEEVDPQVARVVEALGQAVDATLRA